MNMFKKGIVIVTCIVLALQSFVFAAPSEWAEEFVENAISEEVLPLELQTDYQKNIKRYEYVLLALKVIDLNKIKVDDSVTNPFNDISNHKNKDDIIKAYNAGLIGGYEDGSFRPDNEISREEIAALVYNLVKSVNSDAGLVESLSIFSDDSQISTWARPFIEFCYKKSIISGTGKIDNLDTINPKGKATREQAVVLIYKVFKDNTLLNKFDYEEITVGGKIITSNEMNNTAKSLGHDAVQGVLELAKNDEHEIIEISDQHILLEYKNVGIIQIVKTKYEKKMYLDLEVLSEKAILDDYLDLMGLTLENSIKGEEFDNIIAGFKETNNFIYNKTFDDDSFLSASTESFEGVLKYTVLYKEQN